MKRIFPPMNDRPEKWMPAAGFGYWLFAFWFNPFWLPLIGDGFWNAQSGPWLDIVYHAINAVAIVAMFKNYAWDSFLEVQLDPKKFFKTVGVALLLMLASLRYTALSAVDLIRLLEGILPSALMGAAESLIVSTYYNSSAGLVGVSALAALWSASRGIYGLLTGLNSIYDVSENRGYFYTRGVSVLYTFLFLLVLLLTLVLHVFGTAFLEFLIICIYILHLTIAPPTNVMQYVMMIKSH